MHLVFPNAPIELGDGGLPEKNRNSQDSGRAAGGILNRIWESTMEIPDKPLLQTVSLSLGVDLAADVPGRPHSPPRRRQRRLRQ
jgi:hypothetical protein